MKLPKKITSNALYYALLCDDTSFLNLTAKQLKQSKAQPMICGVYASKEEASVITKEVKDCPCKHTIVKCSVSITLR